MSVYDVQLFETDDDPVVVANRRYPVVETPMGWRFGLLVTEGDEEGRIIPVLAMDLHDKNGKVRSFRRVNGKTYRGVMVRWSVTRTFSELERVPERAP